MANTNGKLKLDKVDLTQERLMSGFFNGYNTNMDKIDTEVNRLSSIEIKSKEYTIPIGGTLYLDHSQHQFIWLVLGRGPSGGAKMIAFASGYGPGGIQRNYVEPIVVGSNEIKVVDDRLSIWIKNGSGSILNIKVLALYGSPPVN